MSQERSAEFYRGAVFALNRAQRDFTVTVPELQAEYVDLLAAAEAREATKPTTAEVIAACEKALRCGKLESFTRDEREMLAAALAKIARWKEAK